MEIFDKGIEISVPLSKCSTYRGFNLFGVYLTCL